jgi:integrase
MAAGGQALAVAALVDPGFLAGAGWDRDRQILRLRPDHPQLGWDACRAPGCLARTRAAGFCQACVSRLAAAGIDVTRDGLDVASLPPRPPLFREGLCAVPRCGRVWRSAGVKLCPSHADQQVRSGASYEAFLARDDLRPLPGFGRCQVAACDRRRATQQPVYCLSHRDAYYRARREDGFEEMRWRARAAPVTEPGMVVLRGLPALVIAQVLLGLQRRAGDGLKLREHGLRLLCAELRLRQAVTLEDCGGFGELAPWLRPLAGGLAGYARQALLDPETERDKDSWDLAAFGHNGQAGFTAISQPWLRQCAKDWAVDDLTRRRGRKIGTHLRQRIALIAELSASLATRPDHGDHVTVVGRADIDVFLQRLACGENAGQFSGQTRIDRIEHLKLILARMRLAGVTRPGRAAAGLSDDFALESRDVPERPGRGEPCRDLPAEIMTQLCAQLDELTHPEIRVATELLMDTGRRPEEICALPWDCLARDSDGASVLVYQNRKSNRLARRLPIAEATAQVILAQQQRVRDRYPARPVSALVLLPTSRANPEGTKPVSLGSLDNVHRGWVGSLPPLHASDGREFDKARIVPYAYRHSYAQRHADAGVPPDVLRELMDHRIFDTTKAYYRELSGIASDGRETAGQQVTRLPERRSARPDASLVTWEDSATIPSDA